MANITTRATTNTSEVSGAVTNKGSALTNAELDANFIELNNKKMEGQTVSVDSELMLFSGTTGRIAKRSSANGIPKLTTGVVSVATAGTDYGAPGTAATWTASQRGTVTTDNDGSFNMNVTNNFKCTPTAGFALTFTNITAGQTGLILLINSGGYAVTAAATTKVDSTFLSTVSAAGTYLLSYMSDGTNVYVVCSKALS
jgi:hypothetical protein